MVRKLLPAVGCCLLALTTSAWGEDSSRAGPHGEDSVAFAPDSKWAVTGGSDGRVRIRDGTTGVVLATLVGHKDDANINAVAVSPDGRTIASASNDCSARLWDVERQTERRVLLPPPPSMDIHRKITHYNYCFLAVGFAPDGRTVATGDSGGLVKLWDVESGELRESWSADPKRVNQVLYSPDGATIASVGDDPAVKLWDARSHVLRRTLPQPGKGVLHLAYSPDGATLAVSREWSITLWDPRTGAVKDRLRDCPGYAPALAFTPDGDYLAVADLFRSDLCSVKPRADENDRWTSILSHPNGDGCSALAVSPDGHWVAHCFSTKTRRPTPANFKLVAIR